MQTTEMVRVTLPGHYKRKKIKSRGRRCECGTVLSVYNNGKLCYSCESNGHT